MLYKGDDPYPEKLIHRPEKGVVWGLGGELMKKKLSKTKLFFLDYILGFKNF